MRAARLVWLAALALLMAAPARAQSDGLPTEPMLRINAPSHIAMIRRIATDAAERFAVTASEDKTVTGLVAAGRDAAAGDLAAER